MLIVLYKSETDILPNKTYYLWHSGEEVEAKDSLVVQEKLNFSFNAEGALLHEYIGILYVTYNEFSFLLFIFSRYICLNRIQERRNRLLVQIEEVRRTRALHRSSRRRHGCPSGQGLATVAVVGYTNAVIDLFWIMTYGCTYLHPCPY